MTAEQAEVLGWFTHMLQAASADGGRKRAAGAKVSWKIDREHEGAIYSHIAKWKRGEKVDAESGAHPLVHVAWRCLAIAWQETYDALETPDALDFVQLRRRDAHGAPPAIASGDGNGVAEELDRMAGTISSPRTRNRVID